MVVTSGIQLYSQRVTFSLGPKGLFLRDSSLKYKIILISTKETLFFFGVTWIKSSLHQHITILRLEPRTSPTYEQKCHKATGPLAETGFGRT